MFYAFNHVLLLREDEFQDIMVLSMTVTSRLCDMLVLKYITNCTNEFLACVLATFGCGGGTPIDVWVIEVSYYHEMSCF